MGQNYSNGYEKGVLSISFIDAIADDKIIKLIKSQGYNGLELQDDLNIYYVFVPEGKEIEILCNKFAPNKNTESYSLVYLPIDEILEYFNVSISNRF